MNFSFFICSSTKNMLLYEYFSRFLLKFVLQLSIKKFWKFYELLFFFPENLLVEATNCFKVLKKFISLKVTVYVQDRRLRSEKALHAQCFECKSNCTEMAKYTCDFKHTIYCNIYIQQNMTKQFPLHLAEAYSEPFSTCKQGGYLIGGSYFHKKLHLRCLKRF